MKSNTWQQKAFVAGLIVAAASAMMTTPARALMPHDSYLQGLRVIYSTSGLVGQIIFLTGNAVIIGNLIGFLVIIVIGAIWKKWSQNEKVTVNVHWFLRWCQIILTTLAIVMATIFGGFLLWRGLEYFVLQYLLVWLILLAITVTMIYDAVLPARKQRQFRQQTALTKADKLQTWIMWLRTFVYWFVLPLTFIFASQIIPFRYW
ncbi:hypothetical protein IJJ08_05035 [bacterium]|nr:hypothetical protein [bacterium]